MTVLFEGLSKDDHDWFLSTLDAIEDRLTFIEENSSTDDFINLPLPIEIYEHLNNYVIGQDHAKKVLSVAVYNHCKKILMLKDKPDLEKSNVLLVGPTGSGKTYLIKQLANFLKIPLFIADANSLTQAGYVGKDVESLVEGLIDAAGGDIGQAVTGIIFIDEFDKIITHARTHEATNRDVGGKGVQQALLKLIEGTTVEIERGSPLGKTKYLVNTSHILFIVGGTFIGLEKIIEKRIDKNDASHIGFGASITPSKNNYFDLMKKAMPIDFEKYGFIPEIIGRIPISAALHKLNEKDLIDILSTVKNNPIEQYITLMKYDNANIHFDEAALKAIAHHAIIQDTGARGLKSIIEYILLDTMFDLSDQYITKEFVEEKLKEKD